MALLNCQVVVQQTVYSRLMSDDWNYKLQNPVNQTAGFNHKRFNSNFK